MLKLPYLQTQSGPFSLPPCQPSSYKEEVGKARWFLTRNGDLTYQFLK